MYTMLSMAEHVPVLQTLHSHNSDVNSCDFGGNYYLASGSGDKTVRVWEWSVGEGYVDAPYSPLTAHKYGVTCVRFSPRSTMLATASVDGSTILWNVRTGVRIHTFIQTNGSSVRICSFSPDSTQLVTAGDDGSVCVWNLIHRNLVRMFLQHEGTVQGVAYTPDSSYLLTTCTLGVMKLWPLGLERWNEDHSDSSNCIISIDDAHDLGVTGSEFSPIQDLFEDGEDLSHCYLLATCGNDHDVKLWTVKVGRWVKHLDNIPCDMSVKTSLEGHTSGVTCVRFSPGGNYLASSSLDKTIRVWEVDGSCVAVLEGHSRYVTTCAFCKDGTLLATGSNDKSLIVWDLAGNLNIDSELVKPCSPVSHCGNGNKDCATLQEQEVQTTDVNEVKLLQRLDHHSASVNTCHFGCDSLLASGASDKLVRLCARNEDGRFEETEHSPLEGHSFSVNKVEFSPNGNLLASCSLDGSALIWDVESGRRARPSFQCSGGGLRICRFSPDGHLLVTAGDYEMVSVWNINTLELLISLGGHTDAIVGAAFTPDSQYLATGSSDSTVKLWCVAPCSEECLLNLEDAHDLGVQSCDFSPAEGGGGNEMRYRYLLATCGNDSMIKLWHIKVYPEQNVASGTLWKQLSGHGGTVTFICFSPVTGEILGSTATDKTARLWNVYTGSCLHVLEAHDSLLTSCAFSRDSSLFATAAVDKSIIVWELPQQLIFQSVATGRLRGNHKKLLEWTTSDIAHWLKELNFTDLVPKVKESNLNGAQLLSMPLEDVMGLLEVEDEDTAKDLSLHIFWLKKDDVGVTEIPADVEIPHEFLCPITHEVMRDPVICSDGFTYERGAINEWFLSGKFTSPMTNTVLTDTSCTANVALRKSICQFLYGDELLQS